jgi:F-type H+-transporting ATPase subunit delta
MVGASRTSLIEVTRRLDEVLDTADPGTLAEELFQVVRLFDAEHSLRRVLADSAVSAERKTGLAGRLLESQVSPATILVVTAVVGSEWSAPRDMVDAVERLAVFATVALAEGGGQVDELEDEIFRFGRIVAARPELRSALTRPGTAEQHLRTLVSDLVGDKVNPASARLITEIVVDPRGRTLEQGLDVYGELVAERATRYIAVVRTAVPLGAAQQERLQALLSRRYGRTIHLNIEVVPEIVGGLYIRVGDEVMDGTIAGRVAEVRRRLGG